MNNVKDNLLVKWNFIQFLIVNRFLFVHILYAYLSYLFYIFTLQMFFFCWIKPLLLLLLLSLLLCSERITRIWTFFHSYSYHACFDYPPHETYAKQSVEAKAFCMVVTFDSRRLRSATFGCY